MTEESSFIARFSVDIPVCNHPPARLFSWFVTGINGESIHCVCCCKCGAVLKCGRNSPLPY